MKVEFRCSLQWLYPCERHGIRNSSSIRAMIDRNERERGLIYSEPDGICFVRNISDCSRLRIYLLTIDLQMMVEPKIFPFISIEGM